MKTEFKTNDVNFYYGSQDSLLWKGLNKIFSLELLYEQSNEVIKQRKRVFKWRSLNTQEAQL